ncbi:hypothetical protein CRE_28542 [Caenorhabditis remanei]|uniref:Uncharacterized protein n=1 Tax=Caenorhabditis remanei TaxID=31234 RepID=E3LLQ4_CAERE|nr:hypothetical protein CRE_28542 [Caenorhabditis remanei]
MLRSFKYLYIIGGCALATEREPLRSIERIRVENVENAGSSPTRIKIISEKCGELSVPRRSSSCFLIDNRKEILVAGGCTGPNQHTNSIELLEIREENEGIVTQLLKEVMEIGASCSGFDSEFNENHKPIFGGFEAHSCLDEVQIIDTSDSMWKCRKLGKKLPKIKNSTVLWVSDREFIMFGGWEDEQRTTKAIRRIEFNVDFTDYTEDFAGFLPYPVEGHSSVRVGSTVFLIGGFDGCFVLDTIIKYDLESKKSEILKTKLSEKRENHVSAVLSDKYLVIAGGWNSRRSLDDVEVFEIQNNGGDLELARCHVDGKLLIARNRPTGVRA